MQLIRLMKPELTLPFPSDWPGIPPGMPSGDFLLWQRWREQAASLFDRLYFNVRVGEPVPVAEDLPPEYIKMAVASSRRRIDLVGEKGSRWSLVELKWDAGAEALGQILMYKALWLSDPPDNRPVTMIIVTNSLNKDMKIACKAYNVELLIV